MSKKSIDPRHVESWLKKHLSAHVRANLYEMCRSQLHIYKNPVHEQIKKKDMEIILMMTGMLVVGLSVFWLSNGAGMWFLIPWIIGWMIYNYSHFIK